MRKSNQKNQYKNMLKSMGDYDSAFPPGASSAPVPFPTSSAGLAASLGGVGSWDAIWDLEDASGNPVDTVGGKVFSRLTSSFSYQQPGPTAEKRAIEMTSTGAGLYYDYASGAVGTSDWAALTTVYIPTFTASRSILTLPTYNTGTDWKHPILVWTSGASGLDLIHYNATATLSETLSQTGFTTGTWHDILIVYKRNTGLRYFSSYDTVETDTTPFFSSWPDWTGSFNISIGGSSWATNTILGLKCAYFAFTLDETAVADLYTDGAARLTTFRGLR
jgi:hypothetical protein